MMDERLITECEVDIARSVRMLLDEIRKANPTVGYVSIDVGGSSMFFNAKREPDDVTLRLYVSPTLGKGETIEGESMVDKIKKIAEYDVR